VPVTAYTPRLHDHPEHLRQIAVDVAVELAYDRGYRDGHRAGLAAGHAVRFRVDRDEARRLEAARTGHRRTAATARDERLLDNLRSVGILPAVAA